MAFSSFSPAGLVVRIVGCLEQAHVCAYREQYIMVLVVVEAGLFHAALGESGMSGVRFVVHADGTAVKPEPLGLAQIMTDGSEQHFVARQGSMEDIRGETQFGELMRVEFVGPPLLRTEGVPLVQNAENTQRVFRQSAGEIVVFFYIANVR